MTIPNEFREFLRLIHSKGVEYLLVGGYAVSLYGVPRLTGALDLWVNPEPENARCLVGAIREFGFDTPQLHESLFLQPDQIVRMGHPPLRIELLTTLSGVQFNECYARRRVFTIDEVEVSVISLQDLRCNKQAAGRAKDLADIEILPQDGGSGGEKGEQ